VTTGKLRYRFIRERLTTNCVYRGECDLVCDLIGQEGAPLVLTSVLEISLLEISRKTGIIRRSSVGRIMHDLFIVADSEENSVPVQLGLNQIFIACQFEND